MTELNTNASNETDQLEPVTELQSDIGYESPWTQRRQHILNLSLPIIGGMVSQNVLNLVDTAMVGRLGDAALAAVGMGGFLNWMAMAFITGMSTGVQTLSSRRLGEGRASESAVPLNGGLLLSFSMALPWSILLFFLAPWIFGLMNPDPTVVALGSGYLQARLIGMVAVALNFSFRGYWNGVNLSKIYMRTLIVMHLANILISYVLIFGKLGFPELGATGAGVGTMLSTYLGTGMYLLQAFLLARKNGFLSGIPSWDTLKTMLRVSVPSGVQQLFFAAGMTAFFWIVGRVGTAELAASNVLINLLLVGVLPGMAFGMASASLVGQSLGRKNVQEARRWATDVAQIAAVVVGTLALPAVLFPDFFLELFIQDPQTLELARWPLRLVAATIAFDTVGSVLMQSLLGAGDSRRVMLASVGLQWLLYLPVLFLLTQLTAIGLLGIWGVQVIYRFVTTCVFIGLWRGKHWEQIKV